MSLTISVSPAEEPISLVEAKEAARIDDTAEDTLISAYITAAREVVEDKTRRQLVTATWILKLDSFPSGDIIVPLPPLQSISSINYLDENGDSQTWDSSKYQVDTDRQPGRIAPIETETYPDTQASTFNTVTITFIAGYGTASSVPEKYKNAIKLLVAHWYRTREPVGGKDGGVAVIPFSLDMILKQDRIFGF